METNAAGSGAWQEGRSEWRPGRSFRDREDAGNQLAPLLDRYRDEAPIVLALPRGGVPVAAPVAERVHAPLDVLPVRKIGHPRQPELGLGAIVLDGTTVLDREAIERLGVPPSALARVETEERAELRRQNERFRGGRPLPAVQGRTVILVDDGLATGLTALAAIRAIRALGARRIVLAVPVCAPEALEQLQAELDQELDNAVCVACPPDFYAVGLWYRDFRPTSDETVLALLQRAAERRAGPGTARPSGAQHEPD